MHEMSVAANLIEICEDELKKNGATKVQQIILHIGRLTGIVPESLEFCFDIIKKDTVAAEAKLEIIVIPIELICRGCQSEDTIEEFPWMCEKCGGITYDLKHGNEFLVESMLID